MPPEDQVRDEQGRFAADEAGADAASTEQVPLYKVRVDGDEQEVPLDEALAGYQRQATFTKRMQEVAEREKEIQRREAALAGPNARLGGFGAQPMPGLGTAGDPTQYGGAGAGYPQYEQPGWTMPPQFAQAPPAPQASEEDELDPEGAKARREAAYWRGQVSRVQNQVQALTMERAEERKIEQLGYKYPDFDARAAEAEFYLRPKTEQMQLAALPKSVAMEMLYLTSRRSGVQQPAGSPQTKETTMTTTGIPAAGASPQSPRIDRETPGRPAGRDDDAPLDPRMLGRDRAGSMAAMAKLNRASPRLTMEQERERQRRG